MASSSGPRGTATLLLEDTRKNQVVFSENFGSTWWTPTNSPVLTSGQSDPYGGTAAWLISDDSTANERFLNPPITLDSTVSAAALSLFVREGTTSAASGSAIQLVAGVSRAQATLTWSSGVPSLAFGAGSSVAEPERWRDGWWRIQAASTAGLQAASFYRIFPAFTAAEKGNLYIFGAQLEQ